MTDTIDITVNGQRMTFPATTTIAEVVAKVLGPNPDKWRGVAVAHTSRVVPKSAWETTTVAPNAVVELVTATQGG